MKIWDRRSEWHYGWVKHFNPADRILCSSYEHCRYAILSQSGQEGFSFPPTLRLSALAVLIPEAQTIGPIFFWFSGYLGEFAKLRELRELGEFAKLALPVNPYRIARKQLKFDPEMLLGMLDFHCDSSFGALKIQLTLHRPARLSYILAQAKQQLAGSPIQPKRGAGARVRKAEAALRDLGVVKLRTLMTAPKAMEHTAEILGRALLSTEAQWSRARKRGLQNLQPYNAEAALLCKALAEKTSANSLRYYNGKLEVSSEKVTS